VRAEDEREKKKYLIFGGDNVPIIESEGRLHGGIFLLFACDNSSTIIIIILWARYHHNIITRRAYYCLNIILFVG